MAEPLGPVDTAWLVQITGRRPATIRTLCDRYDDGYDPDEAVEKLDRVRGEVVALTAADAERYLGVPSSTTRTRAMRGHIRPVDHDEHGRPMYALHQITTG